MEAGVSLGDYLRKNLKDWQKHSRKKLLLSNSCFQHLGMETGIAVQYTAIG